MTSNGNRQLFLRNIPFSARAREVVTFLESICGSGSVTKCDIQTKPNGGGSKGYAFVHFSTQSAAELILSLALSRNLCLGGRVLGAAANNRVQHKPQHDSTNIGNLIMYIGNLAGSGDHIHYLWESGNVEAEFLYNCRVDLIISGETKYKLEIHLPSIASIESRTHGSRKCLVFQLYYPPRIYQKPILNYEGTVWEDFVYAAAVIFGPEWFRTTDFTAERVFGQAVVLCLDFGMSYDSDLRNILEKFHDYHLGDYPPRFKPIYMRRGQPYALEQEVVPVLRSTEGYQLPLEVEFKVNYLLQQGYISPACVTSEFFGLLFTSSVERSLTALRKFEIKQTTCLDPTNKLKDFLRRNNRRSGRYLGNIVAEEGQMYVKRLIITPSKAYFFGPELEVSNRVTRNFSHKIDNFLRVTFTEEDYDRLTSCALQGGRGESHSAVYDRAMKVLNEGVEFAGRKFQFLAFSASQLRENSVWMFANDKELTADQIRRWMGEFMAIRNVAKCAARMGQSFSSSTHTLHVSQHELYRLNDIERHYRDGKYCFSDGIGKISKAFAKEVSSKCRASCVPSAFQIRYGGYKGVVAVDPTSPFKLSLRPSMSKFPSSQTGLDVLQWTRYIPCYLNREIIMLLSTLGIPDGVFERMQEQVVEKLDLMLCDEVIAQEVLRTLYAGESHRLILSMLQAGYDPAMEPYLSSLLQAFRACHLLLLQTKSKIIVPKGRCLMGCLDEARVLQYGECFVQLSPPPGSEYYLLEEQVHYDRGVMGSDKAFVLEGRVVVAKNPCLHPGDVLVLRAIDVPELHHMVDCVVFPQQGPRPHPNECSGGDLDGDLYFVSWDKDLIPHSRAEPMNYEAAKAVELDHSVTLQEITKFFVDHMTSDNLGMIANSHLALGDASKMQANDPKCMDLARLFSIAVDFPKTGVPASIPPELRARTFPDFMEKEDKPSYKSERIIGKLYRSVKDHSFQGRVELPYSREFDDDLVVDGYERHVQEAMFHKECYNEKLVGLLNHYNVTEAEIMSGNIRSLSRYYRRRQRDAKDRVVLAAKALVKEARGWFDEGEETGEDMYAKASAWYHVTYDPHIRSTISREEQLLSFPWVVHDRLLHIKRRKRRLGLTVLS